MPTPRLGAPEWTEGEGMPETTGNEIIAFLEAFVGHITAKDRGLADPSALTPDELDTYIVPGSPAGAWSGQAGKIAVFINTDWEFVTPWAGIVGFIEDEGGVVYYDGDSWEPLGLTIDDDETLAAESASAAPTQRAVKVYVDAAVAAVAGSTVIAIEDEGVEELAIVQRINITGAGASVSVAGSEATVDIPGGSTIFASAAEIRTGTEASKAIAPDQLVESAEFQTLADAGTTPWDMAAGFNAKWTLGGNRTLDTPTNPKEGLTYSLLVIQDATGTRTVTWPASFDWGSAGAPTLSTAAAKKDLVTLLCIDAATPTFRAGFNKAS